MGFKLNLIVLSLGLSPLWATAQVLSNTPTAPKPSLQIPSKPQILSKGQFNASLNFRLSRQWSQRLKSSGNGGVVDGGGGNVAADTKKLLEMSTHRGLKSLNMDNLKQLVEIEFEQQIQKNQTEFPDFKDWLWSGFNEQMAWALDPNEFDVEICRNFKFHRFDQNTVACQSMTRAHFNKAWYEAADSRAKAEMIVHELIRYHGIRLAQERGLSKDESDEIVATTTNLILDTETSSQALYEHLLKRGFLLDSTRFISAHARQVTDIINAMVQVYRMLKDMLSTCQTYKESYRAKFKLIYVDTVDMLVKFNNQCRALYSEADTDNSCRIVNRAELLERYASICPDL